MTKITTVVFWNECPLVMKDVIQLFDREILCKFSWSESCKAGGEPVEARLSVTRSNNCNEAEALERRV